jgi:hypothetical protein
MIIQWLLLFLAHGFKERASTMNDYRGSAINDYRMVVIFSAMLLKNEPL